MREYVFLFVVADTGFCGDFDKVLPSKLMPL
jgi:hypothetical protein